MTTAGTSSDGGSGSDGSAAGSSGAQDGATGSGEGQDTGAGTADGQGGTQNGDQGGQDGNGEAARYRRQLRDTERERDTARERLERLQVRELERVAGEELAAPGDLLALGGKALADLLTESGDVDVDKVREAAKDLTSTRPGLRSAQAARGGAGRIGGGRVPVGKPSGKSSWGEALKGE